MSEYSEILDNQLSDYRQMLSAARASIDQLTRERDDLRDWMKCANQFAWAHEHKCPRHDADEPCNCGLDQFLGRPRPYIESWKSSIEKVEQELAAVKRGYAESIEARTR